VRPRDGALQGTAGKGFNKSAPIIGWRIDIIGRIDCGRRRLRAASAH
jgi:hypothetical protein